MQASAADALYIGDSATLSVIGKLDADFLGRACRHKIDFAPTTTGDAIDLPASLVAAQSVVTTRNRTYKAPSTVCSWLVISRLTVSINLSNSGKLIRTSTSSLLRPVVVRLSIAVVFIHGGRSTGKKSSSVLERESEIRRLRKEIKAERKALNALREQVDGIDELRNTAEATVEEQRKRQSDLASEASGLVAQERNQIQKIEHNATARGVEEEVAHSMPSMATQLPNLKLREKN